MSSVGKFLECGNHLFWNVLSVSNLFHSIDHTDFGKTVRPIFEIQSVKKDIQVLIFCFKNYFTCIDAILDYDNFFLLEDFFLKYF